MPIAFNQLSVAGSVGSVVGATAPRIWTDDPSGNVIVVFPLPSGVMVTSVVTTGLPVDGTNISVTSSWSWPVNVPSPLSIGLSNPLIVSLPSPVCKTAMSVSPSPTPKSTESSPLPASTVSAPAPRSIMSSPDPVITLSAPAPVSIEMVDVAAEPSTVSAKSVPTMFSISEKLISTALSPSRPFTVPVSGFAVNIISAPDVAPDRLSVSPLSPFCDPSGKPSVASDPPSTVITPPAIFAASIKNSSSPVPPLATSPAPI